MTPLSRNQAPDAAKPELHPKHVAGPVLLLRQPGLIASSVYMLILSATTAVYVLNGRVGPAYLVLAALFLAGAIGLLMRFRWGWALTLAATVLCSASFLLSYFTSRAVYALEQALIGLVVFLYLVRSEVRAKLR